MLISELARQAGVTSDTIRFYEKRGLLDDRHRTRLENNYKEYSQAALERLHSIAQAKCAGFTLTETDQWFREWDTLGPAERAAMLQAKVQQIEERVAEMEKMKANLTASIPTCLLEKTRCG